MNVNNPDAGYSLDIPQTMEWTKVDDKDVLCRRVDNILNEYKDALEKAPFYRKTAIITARQAVAREEIITKQDGTKNIAEPGDWIIHNPGDEFPYVFGNKKDSLEDRQRLFTEKYEEISGETGKFRSKGKIKAVQVTENLIFKTSWGEDMAVKTGGWISDGGYSIAENSFKNTYAPDNGDA